MSTYMIRRYPWCRLCGQRAVHRSGDLCGGCQGSLAWLMEEPIDRSNPPMEPPRLLRVLRWLGRKVS